MSTKLLIALMAPTATAYLVITPHALLHQALNPFNPWSMHALAPLSRASHKSRQSYEIAPTFPTIRELLADMPQVQPRAMPYERTHWQDRGEHVELTFRVPGGFADDKTATLSAELEDSMDKVTVRGSRAGLKFSHSQSLPFELETESDIDLEHQPRAGLLTLRLRKPKEPEPPQPTALKITRVQEEVAGSDEGGGGEDEAARAALPDVVASEELAPPVKEAAAAELRDGKSEQQALDEKFAFVTKADPAPKRAEGPEAE